MGFCYHLGKTIFLLAVLVNAYLIILDPYFKKDFEQQFKDLPAIFPQLNFLTNCFKYLYHIRIAFGMIQVILLMILYFIQIRFSNRFICILNIIVLLLITTILNLSCFFSKNKDEKFKAIPRILYSLTILSGFLIIMSRFPCETKVTAKKQQGKKKRKTD